MLRLKPLSLTLFIAAAVTALLLVSFLPANSQAQTAAPNPITPELAERMANQPDQPIRFIVTLHEQIDLAAERLPSAELPLSALCKRWQKRASSRFCPTFSSYSSGHTFAATVYFGFLTASV